MEYCIKRSFVCTMQLYSGSQYIFDWHTCLIKNSTVINVAMKNSCTMVYWARYSCSRIHYWTYYLRLQTRLHKYWLCLDVDRVLQVQELWKWWIRRFNRPSFILWKLNLTYESQQAYNKSFKIIQNYKF